MEFTMAMWLSVSAVLRGFEEGSEAKKSEREPPAINQGSTRWKQFPPTNKFEYFELPVDW